MLNEVAVDGGLMVDCVCIVVGGGGGGGGGGRNSAVFKTLFMTKPAR